jgi:hypothetical protein
MTTTNHLGVTLLEQAQAQKEVTVNEALSRIDAILNTGAVTQSVSTPPGSPVAGAVYIIGSSPTGAWAGKAKQITYFDQIWRFIVPNEGMSLWVNDEDLLYSYDGTNWVVPSGSGTGTVTSVSVTTANGISGSVATATTTPAITLTLGAITPSSVAATGTVSGSNLSGTNTGDQTITLTGNVTGSGTGSFTTTIANGAVTNAMLAGSIDLATKVTGALPVANGGTGQTTANAALNALLPTQTGNSGKVLSTDGSNTSWIASGGSGTVTSVSVTTANGVSGSVATATTTPAITLTLGAITPSSVAATGTVSGSNLSGTNTGDQTITLTGNVTGSGTGSFATTIANGVVTNAMLAGNIDLTTKVTGILPAANGGTANGFTAFSGPATSTKTFTLPNASDSIACLGQVNAFTKQQYFVQTTLTDATSISWDVSANQAATVTLGGNRTLSNPTNLQAGASYTLIVKQDGTGSRTLAYGSVYKWPSGTAPVLTTTANATDILTFISDGTNMYGVAQKGFA